ncbi:SDR family NAD(P)-dependent oxidoreductase [Amycolatopsis sp. NPDC049253]|uniref:SDR family NAD(P)-dependent oxidoreductase n=1 Tax=Amycolatopsis sp. NPDC049253 TaxID=3155274 RepID=UPI003424DC59
MVLPLVGPYGATKWALEALAETLSIEAGHFGVKVSIVQPGVVSSGSGGPAKVCLPDGDPYTPLVEALGVLRGEAVTREAVAATVADTIEQAEPALRVPAGAPAEQVLEARKVAPEDRPFLMREIDWSSSARAAHPPGVPLGPCRRLTAARGDRLPRPERTAHAHPPAECRTSPRSRFSAL